MSHCPGYSVPRPCSVFGSSDLRLPSSVPKSPAVRPQSSAPRCLPSTVCHLASDLRAPSSIVCCLASVLSPQSSVLCPPASGHSTNAATQDKICASGIPEVSGLVSLPWSLHFFSHDASPGDPFGRDGAKLPSERAGDAQCPAVSGGLRLPAPACRSTSDQPPKIAKCDLTLTGGTACQSQLINIPTGLGKTA